MPTRAHAGLSWRPASYRPLVRPLPALVLAALAAMGLVLTSSADDRSPTRAAGSGSHVRIQEPQPGALSLEDVTRTLRNAGWPEDRLAEALAVSGCESGWRPNAVGTAGEIGLFQLHPVNAGRFDFHGAPLDPANPTQNAYIALRIWERDGWAAWSCRPQVTG